MKKIHVSFCIIIFLFIATLIICINYSSASAKDFNEYKNLLKQTLANENWQEMNRISDDVIKFYPDNDFGYFFKEINCAHIFTTFFVNIFVFGLLSLPKSVWLVII